MRKYLCGVNKADCTGDFTMLNSGMGKSMKTHISSEDAFKCYSKFLIKQGYIRIGSREFFKEGNPILVLTKKCRFGGILRRGKNLEGTGKSFCPKVYHQAKSGTIIST